MILIHKGDTDTGGIGLLETLWKVVEALIETCLRASLHFHEVLHRLQAGRRTGTAIMELKLAQEITHVYCNPLFLVFLDLMKAYETFDTERLILTLEGYGAGSRLCGILETFWDH